MTSRRLYLSGYAAVFLVACIAFFSLTFNREWTRPAEAPALEVPEQHLLFEQTSCVQLPQPSERPVAAVEDAPSPAPVKRRNVVVASAFPHHFDVYMTVVWTLERVLSYVPDYKVHVFAEPFNYGFQSLVDRLSLYHGRRRPTSELVPFMSGEEGETVDMIVLGTCEIDLRSWHSDLLAAWDARSPDHKFQLVCIVHNVKDLSWQTHITDWSRRGAISLLPIADHVKASFRKVFNQHADSTDTALNTAGYESIPIHVHVPVLDLPSLPAKDLSRSLSKAIIQGTFNNGRRDYVNFFSDLIKSLHEDPAAWGYHPLGQRKSFVPDHHSPIPPFEVALVGAGQITIPEELAYVVTIYHDLDYEDFYKLIAGMDIVVPAFADFGYYEDQASSTVALAVELDVPILATERMRKAYGYIDDDRAVVTRPAAMREVYALRALRTGDASSFLDSDPTGSGLKMRNIRGLEDAVHDMLAKGWTRDGSAVRQYKNELWDRNEVAIQRLLRA